MALILTVTFVALLLLINEFWTRWVAKPGELSRKFIHISIGSFVAFWPFFLSRNEILLLSVGFVVGIGISKYFNIFKAIHSVQRLTYGELFFGAAVGLAVLITESKGVYAAALLHMSLADGLAAIVGIQFGASNRYSVLGNVKSVAGTATFFIISLALLFGYSIIGDVGLNPVIVIGIAASASLLENMGAYGLDNLLVPLMIAVVLRST